MPQLFCTRYIGYPPDVYPIELTRYYVHPRRHYGFISTHFITHRTSNKLDVNEAGNEVKIKQVQANFTICQDSVILRYSSLNKTTCMRLHFRYTINLIVLTSTVLDRERKALCLTTTTKMH